MEKMAFILGFIQKVGGKSVLVRETSGAKVLRLSSWLSFGVLAKEKGIGRSEEKGAIRRQSTGFYTRIQDFAFYSECDGKLSK